MATYYYLSSEMMVGDVLEEGFRPIQIVKEIVSTLISTTFVLEEVQTKRVDSRTISPMFSTEEGRLLERACYQSGLEFSVKNQMSSEPGTISPSSDCLLFHNKIMIARMGKVEGLYCIVPFFPSRRNSDGSIEYALISDGCLDHAINRLAYCLVTAP